MLVEDVQPSDALLQQQSVSAPRAMPLRLMLRVAVAAAAALALGVTGAPAEARPAPDAKAEYVRDLDAAYTNFARIGKRIDRAIRQADRKSDKKSAKQFGVLAQQTRAAGAKVARLKAPPTVAGQHKLLVRAISEIADDLTDIARSGRKSDLDGVRRAGERFFGDVRALERARNALVQTLEGQSPPADATALATARR